METEELHHYFEYWEKYRKQRGFIDPLQIQSLRFLLGISIGGFEKLFGLIKGQFQYIAYGYPLTMGENERFVKVIGDTRRIRELYDTNYEKLGNGDRSRLMRWLPKE